MGLKRRTGTKSPPFLSSEFFIQNHADIVSCVAMFFVLGLLFQATSSIASVFVVMHHNVTDVLDPHGTVYYTYGRQDLCVIFFYFLIAIVMHAILQEYALDKLNRKLHLSKVKHSKFNESGQLLVFYLLSLVWGGDIIAREGYLLNITKLWHGYPHSEMTFMFKFYYIVQLAYWLHCYPELYFQKVKKEEMKPRLIYTTLYLVFLGTAYVLNFTRIAVCLSVVHYLVESIFHIARLLYFAEKTKAASYGFMIWNSLFVLVRLGSITISVLTFWYGLALHEQAAGVVDIATGNFNTPIIRINCLVAVCLLQAWMMWNFITFHLQRRRERASQIANSKKKALAKKEKKLKKEELKKSSEEDVSELPEVDQNTKKDLRARVTAPSASSKSKRN